MAAGGTLTRVSNPVVGFGKAWAIGSALQGAFLVELKCEQERTQPNPGQSSTSCPESWR